ncbi:cellulose synthase A catalytic subunit 5 [UDP-forming]-like isoform X1 [Iris pallida]|uniref:Cellulose synthase A catalytic subunit 5 [UDP-forming]-like isoform X1 n=1 Tax=Iris pallida TaxID=29817 RepID=A0AAX6GS78_IRIPA|nr:cellulose synthase A catalytic subunit 5 [UDP-forming]-like isoform X1 [Iris pallida]
MGFHMKAMLLLFDNLSVLEVQCHFLGHRFHVGNMDQSILRKTSIYGYESVAWKDRMDEWKGNSLKRCRRFRLKVDMVEAL